jgi:serine/threonine protein kinase
MTGLVLDGKYAIDRQLGEGGMGTVYLARHLGTKRLVALKVIVPRKTDSEEFIERFRREAEAAGGLRHPNIVDVTDFGFTKLGDDELAYLVMEYLDGCSLADVLAEEKTISLDWTVDIIEQTCDAIDEAHRRGIIHRDLKPQNIWLEPNRRGGFTVKVLDFGLAKIQDAAAEGDEPGRNITRDLAVAASLAGLTDFLDSTPDTILGESGVPTEVLEPPPSSSDTQSANAYSTNVGNLGAFVADVTAHDAPAKETIGPGSAPGSATIVDPAERLGVATVVDGTVVGYSGFAPATLLDAAPTSNSTGRDSSSAHSRPSSGGRSLDAPIPSNPLTQVGTVLGTPVYMSPEQCRGPIKDPRTDIYSLGIITYEMLTGHPPFSGGDVLSVLARHLTETPKSLHEVNPDIPPAVSDVVLKALAKHPEERHARASVFASTLRANAEGTGAIFRRAAALVSEHFGVFWRLILIALGPLVTIRIVKLTADLLGPEVPFFKSAVWQVGFGLVFAGLATFFAAALMRGVSALLLTQVMVSPLGRVRMSIGKALIRKRFMRLLDGGLWYLMLVIAPLVIFLYSMGAFLEWASKGIHDGFGLQLGLVTVGSLLLSAGAGVLTFRNVVDTSMLPIALLVEGLGARDALRRSRMLVSRARQMIVPVAMIELLGYAAILTFSVVAFGVIFDRVLARILSEVFAIVLEALVLPLLGVAYAGLYLKLRQAGGETIHLLLDDEYVRRELPKTKWMEQMQRASRSSGERGRVEKE